MTIHENSNFRYSFTNLTKLIVEQTTICLFGDCDLTAETIVRNIDELSVIDYINGYLVK